MFAASWRRALAVAALGLAASLAQAQSFSYTTFQVPGATLTNLWDINNQGQIVGFAAFGAEETGVTHQSFLLDRDTLAMTPYAAPGNDFGTLLTGLSDTGVLVGSYRVAGPVDAGTGLPQQISQAFIQDGSSFQTLAVPGAHQADARGITPDGRYVSGMYFANDAAGIFVYDRTSASFALMRDAPGVGFGIVNGANASGTLVGTEVGISEDFSTIDRVAFRYEISTGSFSEYAGPQGDMLSPRAVSDSGVIAGWLERDGVTLGFVDRNGVFDDVALDGSTTTQIQGINNDGWLVGSATVDGIVVGVIAAPLAPPVPEPGTYALLAVGLVFVGWSARRRRAR